MSNKAGVQRTNKLALLANGVVDLFLIAGYTLELIKGGRTPLFYSIVLFITLIHIIAPTAIYLKDKENKLIKVITVSGYLLMYVTALFTTDRITVFTFAFPILATYMLYYNFRFMLISCATIMLTNIVHMFYNYFYINLKGMDSTDYTIQFAAVFLYCFSMLLTTRHSNHLSDEKLKSIRDEEEKQEAILADVLEIAAVLLLVCMVAAIVIGKEVDS
jgi:uncharacterized membrane protein